MISPTFNDLFHLILDHLHLLRLRWQYSSSWKGKIAVMKHGGYVDLSRSREKEPPQRDGFYWMSEHGTRHHSRDIVAIIGAEAFGY